LFMTKSGTRCKGGCREFFGHLKKKARIREKVDDRAKKTKEKGVKQSAGKGEEKMLSGGGERVPGITHPRKSRTRVRNIVRRKVRFIDWLPFPTQNKRGYRRNQKGRLRLASIFRRNPLENSEKNVR